MDLGTAILRPDSVALIGATDNPQRPGSRPQRFLKSAGYRGRVYLVNPSKPTVQGDPAYADLAQLPETPDHAFILTSAERAVDALRSCGELGVPVATILDGGFADAGSDGEDRVAALREIVATTGIRLLGPNSIGVVNLHHAMPLTANSSFAERDRAPGTTFVASQSGSMIGALASKGGVLGASFSGFVSTGSEIDLTLGEICAATLDDDNVRDYLLFVENTRGSAQLRQFALQAYERGKPVVAYKLGRSEVGAELSQTHTGALAGDDALASQFLADSAIARVQTLDGLLEAGPLLHLLPVDHRKRLSVGLLTTTGGGAAMVVDELGVHGIDVVPPSAGTRERIRAAELPGTVSRIVDLTLAGTRREVMTKAVDIMSTAPEFDLVIVAVGSSARSDPDLVLAPIIEAAATTGDGRAAIAPLIVPEAPEALSMLHSAGVAAFHSAESLADVIVAAGRRRTPRPISPAPSYAKAPPLLNELDAYQVLDQYGIPRVASTPVTSAADYDGPFDPPVVAKALAADLPHKSDLGCVVLEIGSPAELDDAIASITSRCAAAGVELDGVIVQPMLESLGEVLLGLRNDPGMGQFVVLSAGGVLTEIYRDTAIRPVPVSRDSALEMISEVKAMKALGGYRGRAAGDLNALADTIVAFSTLATSARPLDAEINPLLVRADGVVAVDAVIRMSTP